MLFATPQVVRRAGRPPAVTRTVPAPIDGWNARDMLSAMKPTEAWVLDNWIPDDVGVKPRRGISSFATGMDGNYVESLMEYNSASGTTKLFAATPAKIFDASSAGAVGAAAVSSLSNARWQHRMMATSGGKFLVIANGADSVRNYDGSSWTTPTINNVTSSTLIDVCLHQRRLWFAQKSTTKAWYLGTESISGDATAFEFGPLFKKGGELYALESWSVDGGAGMDDMLVAVSSKGEIAVYAGTDPDSADTWALKGVFAGPEPIGRRCFVKLGADLCYLSAQGVIPLPQFLMSSGIGRTAMAVTDLISGAFRDAYLAGGTLHGWQVLEYPKEKLLLVNVPISERGVHHQYVMNTQTKKWGRLKGINACCMSLKGDSLYFGGVGGQTYFYGGAGVYSDDGEPISALAGQAYNSFGYDGDKSFKSARALFNGPSGYVPQIRLLLNYDNTPPAISPASFTEIGAAWDDADWDDADWAASDVNTTEWRPLSGIGHAASLCLASSVTRPLTWNKTQVQFEVGRAQ